jgi:hypothetical protein
VKTKAEIIATIQAGTDEVRRTFEPLDEAQLQTQVHTDEGGWTARDLLAHLAARQPVNDHLFGIARGDATPFTGNVDAGRWNQALVDAQSSKSKEALLAQFQAVQDDLIAAVQDLPDDVLARTIPLPNGEMPLGDVLALAGGAHASHHAQEVAQALTRTTSAL